MFNQPQLQSSLGDITSTKTSKDRNWNNGYLALGRVIRVHPKRYTADVQIFGSHDKIMSTKDQEGRHSCRICVENAGFDSTYGKAYGRVIPIQKGSLVLVGYLMNTKEKPIIISVLHNIGETVGENNSGNILNASYSSETDDYIGRYLDISPNQDFKSVDLDGNFEIASHTKSFIVGKEKLMDDEYYDFEDLEVKDANKNTIHVDEAHSKPKKYMAVFRDNFLDSLTNWLKIIVDATKTSLRIAKLQQSKNRSTYIEIAEDGAFTLRRQLDTKSFDKEQCKQYSEITITADGKTQISFIGATHTVFTINPDGSGVTLDTTDDISIKTEKNIHVKGRDMDVVGENMSVQGKDMTVNGENISVTCEHSELQCSSADVSASSIKVDSGNIEMNSGTIDVTSGEVNVVGTVNVTGIGFINGRRIACQGDMTSDRAVII